MAYAFCRYVPSHNMTYPVMIHNHTTAITIIGIIEVIGLDLLDGTPILDIKPYVPAFDAFPDARAGWMDDIDGGDYIR